MRYRAAAVALCVSVPALAQPVDDDVRFSLGGGVARAPKYPGADSYRVRAFPVVSLSFGRFFVGGEPGAGGPAAGVNLLRESGWRAGIGLTGGFNKPRSESDHPSLQGMGDIERTVRAVAFASYTRDWLTASTRVSTDVGGEDQGTLVFFDLLARYRATERLSFSAGPGVTWADSEYMMTFFGVTAEQSARSGLPEYHAGSGINALRFSLGASYRIDHHWGLGGRVSASRLQGDATGSPITLDANSYSAALFASYRF